MTNNSLSICPCCMKHHDVRQVLINDSMPYKGVDITYVSQAYYCDEADEYFYTEDQMRINNIAVKDAYKTKRGLMTSEEIKALRNSYGISQTDLCILLGWGEKTIARYETFQVQDKAHDLILRKLLKDPAWFIDLLKESKGKLSETAYNKYLKKAEVKYANASRSYEYAAKKARALASRYAVTVHG